MTTTTRPELTPVLDRNGRQRFADGGAAKNTLRPMKECSGCDTYVAFVQNQAGKWYLVNCYRYANQSEEGRFYYRKDCLHKCPGKQEAPVQEVQETLAEILRERIAVCDDALANAGPTATAQSIADLTNRVAVLRELLAKEEA